MLTLLGMADVHRKKLIEALERNDKDAIASFQTDQRGAISAEQGPSGRMSQGNASSRCAHLLPENVLCSEANPVKSK